MTTLSKKYRFAMLVVPALFILGGGLAFAKKTEPEMVKQEDGYYYGYGKGGSLEDATLEAKKDLVSSALTTAVRTSNPKSSKVEVSSESAEARLGDIKPFAKSKSVSSPSVTLRMKLADWDKKELAYEEKLRADLAPRYDALLTEKNISKKLNESLSILSKLFEVGETDLLTAQDGGTELLSRKVEDICKSTSSLLKFEFSVADGLVNPATKFTVKVTDNAGKPVDNLSLSVYWEVTTLTTDDTIEEIPEVRSFVKTNSIGTAAIEYPVSEEYHNKSVTLSVSTSLAETVPSSAALRKLDAENTADACYVQFDDVKSAFATYTVPAGEFNAGSVAQDTRAGKKEASHVASTGSYAIGLAPVTNAQYAAFLHATRSDKIPEYFYNSDYNKANQPVVGVTYDDAEMYAAWLSSQTGNKYRLPTEEEWEKAARAGKETIYPWGDDSPADNKKANYNGNGVYTAPSAVGAFENGKNEWGLVDMAGNVWEWTSSTHGNAETTDRIVKGGSWMDGPTELRISNYRSVSGLESSADIGFRLVMEVTE